jgi:hypothetical protein
MTTRRSSASVLNWATEMVIQKDLKEGKGMEQLVNQNV